MIAIDLEKLGPEITWYVNVGTEKYEVEAYSAAHAVRQALIVYLDVQHWDDENKGLWNVLDLSDILDGLPEGLDVYAIPNIDSVCDDEEEDEEWTLN